MADRVFLLNRFRDGASRKEFERFVREVDYPTGRSLEGILGFDVTRIRGPLAEGESSPFEYIEVVDIESLESYLAILDTPVLEAMTREWSKYIEKSFVVHGTVIE